MSFRRALPKCCFMGAVAAVAHNIIWKPTGQPSHEPATAFWIPGSHIIFADNLIGADNASFGGPAKDGMVASNAYALGAPPGFDTRPVDLRGKPTGLIADAAAIDGAAAKVEALFAGPAQAVQQSTEVESLFAAFSGKAAEGGPLFRSGVDLKLSFAGKAPNIGSDTPPWRLADLYRAFDALGLKHYDANGAVASAPPVGWALALQR